MGDIIKKMDDEIPKTFLGNYVLLATHVAKTPHDSSSTIQTVFFVAFRCVAHNKFLLKITTSTIIKKYPMAKLIYWAPNLFLFMLGPSHTNLSLFFVNEQFNYF